MNSFAFSVVADDLVLADATHDKVYSSTVTPHYCGGELTRYPDIEPAACFATMDNQLATTDCPTV